VIVSADMGAMTLACVDAVGRRPGLSVFVVDNRGERAPGDAHEQIAERATIVPLKQAVGFAAANNRGAELGEAPYLLLLNSDILVTAGAIDALVAALDDDPGAVAVGGRLVDPDTLVTQAEYRPRPFPTLINFVVILLAIEEHWPGNPVTRRYHGAELDEHALQAVDQPAAAAVLVRRAEFDAIGGFDERFWFWFEDSDLLLRLRARGRNLYVPTAVFRHLGGGTFRRWGKPERIRSVHHGIVHYGDAHFSRLRRALLGLVVLAVSAPRALLFVRARPDETRAWRAVAAAGIALIRGRRPPAVAPGPAWRSR
jgi:N-acetylglucosaminyl-diphospho-decaprenol L-rhamnosyltransferase